MESAHPAHLPADEASLDEVHPDAWQRKITPDAFYEEVRADPRARARMEAVLTEINERQTTLAQVRKARELTQATIAELLKMDQSEVSRLEHRSNMLLSTLRSFIRATGGELQLIVTFPDAEPVELLVGSRTADPSEVP
jgi:DNA-directed RNA polymerase specialized sigma subunit